MSRTALSDPSALSTFSRSLACLVFYSALVGAAPCQAEETTLGRLFFTPERRQAMDRQRQLNLPDKEQTEDAAKLTINGVVTRSNCKRTVWVNGVVVFDKDAATGARPGQVVRRAGWRPLALGAILWILVTATALAVIAVTAPWGR